MLKTNILFCLFITVSNSLTCYECEQSAEPCTETCQGTSCVTSFATIDISSYRQTTYCMSDGIQNGCMGDMNTQTFYCYCTTDYCNTPLNTTIHNTATMASTTTTTYYFTPTTTTYASGRKRRNAFEERIQEALERL